MIKKTIYKNNLLPPYSVTVECGSHKKEFLKSEFSEVGKWILNIWNNDFFPTPAYVYYNIDWDSDHILYCKYEKEN